MKYYDQHIHTYYSYDSKETFENYLALTDNYLVTTEHLDFNNSYSNYEDNCPDYEAYSREIAALNEKYDNRILKGIEIGYRAGDKEKLEKYLEGKDYDVILLSAHQNEKYDYMLEEILEQSLEETMYEYYEQMIEAVTEFSFANIVTHFDYGLRLYDVSVEDLKKVEPLLKKLFKKMIENEQAFELNAKSMYHYNNAHLYDYAIPLYQSVGGKLFTVGSDAHVAKHYEYKFKEMFEMLEKHGVEELVVFQDQQPIMVKRP